MRLIDSSPTRIGLQSWTRLFKKTGHWQKKKTLLYHISLLDSTTVTFPSPPPPPLPMQYWFGKCLLPGNCSWTRKTTLSRGKGGKGFKYTWSFACLPVKALWSLILLTVLSTIVGNCGFQQSVWFSCHDIRHSIPSLPYLESRVFKINFFIEFWMMKEFNLEIK